MLLLDESWQAYLLSQPETGMGYQFAEITLDTGIVKYFIYNADMAVELSEAKQQKSILEEYERLHTSRTFSKFIINEIRVLPRNKIPGDVLQPSVEKKEFRQTINETIEKYTTTTLSAKDSRLSSSGEYELFKRFCAFQNDRRINAQKGLMPNSYATTASDATNVKSGIEAVERYALPSPTPASWVFTIRPLKGTKLRRGIVQPGYGHAGGGVEILFPNGTDANTVVLPPSKIPKR